MPTLEDYEYQFGDGEFSVRLNETTDELPYWDVYRVGGLDIPSFRTIIQEIDGKHGADVYARFLGPRAIVVEGILLAEADDIETQLDLLKDSLFDIEDGFESRKFYWKHPGVVQRYCTGKTVGFTSDVAVGRRTGKMPFVLSILCEDPITYFDNEDLEMTNATNNQLVNDGNVDTGIRTVFQDGTLSGTTTIKDVTNGDEVTFAVSMIGGDKVEVDTGLRRIQKNNVDVTASVISDEWFLNKSHGENQVIKVTWTGTADVKVQHKSGWW